jgi:hypothetical protein
VARTGGPVLELGCGDYSTPLLHLLCRNRPLVSVETDRGWLERYSDLRTKDHEFHLAQDWAGAAIIDQREWDVALVDHAPGERRVPEIRRLINRARFIVVHDTEDGGYGYDRVLPEFKYRFDFKRWEPWTSVVSMVEEFKE